MITYTDIYESARKERYADSLQPLPEDFILEVKNYLNEKKQIALKEDSDFSDIIIKTKKQIENAITLFKELMVRRRKKILNLVLIAAETGISRQDFEHMLSFEKELFEDLMGCIEKSDGKTKKIMDSKEQVEERVELKFKENVGEFMGLNGKKIGPFKKDEEISIQKDIANILVEGGKAEIIE
jgi:DNA replication initiation complex subunit (GINS family)